MGRPKAWLPFRGELMLPRIVRLLSEVVSPVVVVAAPGQEVPPLPAEVALMRDEVNDRGPLQGMATGLKALAGQCAAAYVSSCDAPLLRPEFIHRMIDLLQENDICVPRVGDHDHPLAAVYRLSVLNLIERLLTQNRLRPVFLFEEARMRIVEAADLVEVDPEMVSLRNVNTIMDYCAALEKR